MSGSSGKQARAGPHGRPGLPAWSLGLPELVDGAEGRPPLRLQPRSPIEILDGAFKMLRANARSIALTVLTLVLPAELLIAFLQRNVNGGSGIAQVFDSPATGQSSGLPVGATIAAFAVIVVVIPLVCAGVSRIVLTSVLGGVARPRDALLSVLKHSPALLVATLVVHLAEAVGSLGFVSIYFVMPLFMLTAPTISLEDLGPWAGIRRSVRLAAQRYWPTVGVCLLSSLLVWLLGQALNLVPSAVAVFIGLHWGWLIVAVSDVLSTLITVSATTTIATLVYLDVRVRREGLDLQVRAAHLDQRLARQVPPSPALS